MLKGRLISTVILVGILSLLVWLDLKVGDEDVLGRPGLILAPLALVAIAVGVIELADLFRSGKLPVSTLSCLLATIPTVVLGYLPILWDDYPSDCPIGKSGWVVLGLAAGIGCVLVNEMIRFRTPGQTVQRVALAIFVAGYLGVLMTFLAWLRWFEGNEWGMVALLSLILVVKVSDSGAYIVGKTLGKHKMAPVLSPGKTIEGMVGALVGGILASFVAFWAMAPWLTGSDEITVSWWAICLYGVVVTLAGVVGDLAESLIKRDMNRKDASKLMPGLGGILDVLDSILAAAPAAYVLWLVGIVGPQ